MQKEDKSGFAKLRALDVTPEKQPSDGNTLTVSAADAAALRRLHILNVPTGVGFPDVRGAFPSLRWLGTNWRALACGQVPLRRVPGTVFLKAHAAKVLPQLPLPHHGCQYTEKIPPTE